MGGKNPLNICSFPCCVSGTLHPIPNMVWQIATFAIYSFWVIIQNNWSNVTNPDEEKIPLKTKFQFSTLFEGLPPLANGYVWISTLWIKDSFLTPKWIRMITLDKSTKVLRSDDTVSWRRLRERVTAPAAVQGELDCPSPPPQLPQELWHARGRSQRALCPSLFIQMGYHSFYPVQEHFFSKCGEQNLAGD